MRGAFSTALGQHSAVFRHLLPLEGTDIEWNSQALNSNPRAERVRKDWS